MDLNLLAKDRQDHLRKDTVIAIHQPNYLPWLGYFYKICASDVFVFHDNVEHSKRYPTRRTRIRKAANSDESCWLTVPLKKHSDFTLIKDLEVDQSQDWQGKHLRKIRNSYSGTPFFPAIFLKIENWLAESEQFDLLADMNIFLVRKVMQWLGIEREIWRSSELPVAGNSSLYNLALVKQLGGTVYLSGKGGASYQEQNIFIEQGVALRYTNLELNLPANFQTFIGKSIVDLMLNFGPEQSIQLISWQQVK